MSLADAFVRLAEERYDLDWPAVAASVQRRLAVPGGLPPEWLDPRQQPTAWCVPILVGDYLGASPEAVRADTEAYLHGYAVRQLMFHGTDVVDRGPEVQLLAEGFRGCRRDALAGTDFAARFAAKCWPWTVVLTLGTERVRAETDDVELRAVLGAVVETYTSLQIVDDWHDRAEDAGREHWNIWTDEPAARTLAVVPPLLERGRRAVARMRPHLLRRALVAQLEDTRTDLADIAARLPVTA